jgi:hypothetical protein
VTLEEGVAESVAYLDSARAERDIARDPYWPKWDSPWWHMVLLHELGLAERIPRRAAAHMARAIDRHFLHEFPFRLEQVPAGLDPFRHIVCHCALGTMFRVLHDCGVDVDREIGWARSWFLRYQLADGGLNCDEGAYLRSPPRSSFVSTLPAAEALPFAIDGKLDAAERSFLSRVASYLTRRSLIRSLSKDRVIDPEWLVPCFPRFYFYDALRGLRFLAVHAERCAESVPRASVQTALDRLGAWFGSRDRDSVPREPHREVGTYGPSGDGSWRSLPRASSFALLDAVGASGAGLRRLEREWREVGERLAEPGALS